MQPTVDIFRTLVYCKIELYKHNSSEVSQLFSEKLRELRKEHGFSQEELANKLDISRQSVSKWELGVSMPDLDNVIKLSELCDVISV